MSDPIWVDFNDTHDNCVTALLDWHRLSPIGTVVTVGDHDGNRCQATLLGINESFDTGPLVVYRLDRDTFQPG